MSPDSSLSGESGEGTLRRSVELASGKYALVENSREFILVPRWPLLERHIGMQVSASCMRWYLLDHRSAEGWAECFAIWYSLVFKAQYLVVWWLRSRILATNL